MSSPVDSPPATRSGDLCDECNGWADWICLYRNPRPIPTGPSEKYPEDYPDAFIDDPDETVPKFTFTRSLSAIRENVGSCPLCAFLVPWVEHSDESSLQDETCRYEVVFRFPFSRDCYIDVIRLHRRENTPISLGTFDVSIRHLVDPESGSVRQPLNSTVDYDRIQGWVSDCTSKHGHPPEDEWIKPAFHKLIEIGGFKLINLQTFEIDTIRSHTIPPYVALSYVWGPPELQMAYKLASERDPQPGIRLDLLPRTLKDAMLLARDLGRPYIWIDYLCIDQNPASATKPEALKTMGAIYAAAELVIVAVAGSDAAAGLPGVRGHRRFVGPSLQTLTRNGFHIELLHKPPPIVYWLHHTRWATRGWTFQEYIFARKILLVSPYEMFFACADDSLRREIHPPGITQELFPQMETDLRNRKEEWDAKKGFMGLETLSWPTYAYGVEQYTKRALTFERDRLDAFKGMRLGLDGGDSHDDVHTSLATGLPMRYFDLALTWEPQGFAPLPDGLFSTAPSWSWASAGLNIHYPWRRRAGDIREASRGFSYTAQEAQNNILGCPKDHYVANATFCRTNAPRIKSLRDSIQFRPEPLPVLHLITITFYSYLHEKIHRYSFPADIEENKYFPPAIRMNRRLVGTRTRDRTSPFQFAVVATFNNRHSVMALHKENGHYWRMGLLTVSDESFVKILQAKEANPSWAYVQLR